VGAIGADTLHRAGLTGKNVTVGIVDAGSYLGQPSDGTGEVAGIAAAAAEFERYAALNEPIAVDAERTETAD
jgi:subtilase family serine protease